ncbi:hypothetical protein [Ancylobacter radicis]|uniref:Uncharacterized protein n=1 Tax=Ancylobacter radicis TaxID=2836179 RepID=A0ABS5R5L7_9HYPH|nr:hypothetical protein [Ancylobacter radicis]MBS9476949.1 hypothetical protein [Ancylobacter radicis]
MRLNLQLDRELVSAMLQKQLTECERYLALRSLTEALRKEAHLEIEQVVRTPGELARRVRSNVQLAHDAKAQVIGGRLTVERDGEPIFEWILPPGRAPYLVASDTDMDHGDFMVTNSALTAIMLHAAAIEKRMGDSAMFSDVQASCEHIASNARRAWQALSLKFGG